MKDGGFLYRLCRNLVYPTWDGSECCSVLPSVGTEGCEEEIRQSARAGCGDSQDADRGRERRAESRDARTNEALTMVALMKNTVKTWWLVVVSASLLVMTTITFVPQPVEYFYPTLDWAGGNQCKMETLQQVYHCGDTVYARMNFQKQRNAIGEVKWMLRRIPPINNFPVMFVYPPRIAAAPIGIYNAAIMVEQLPRVCEEGDYYFDGTITYPLFFGKTVYSIKTTTFRIKP